MKKFTFFLMASFFFSLPVSAQTYTVKKGDTLFSIAKKHNVTVKELKENNKIKNESIKIGQNIMILVGGKQKQNKVIPMVQKKELKEMFATVNAYPLNVRSAPSLQGKIVNKIKTPLKVKVIEYGDAWSKVSVEGMEGYVYSKFLTIEKAGGKEMEIPSKTEKQNQIKSGFQPKRNELKKNKEENEKNKKNKVVVYGTVVKIEKSTDSEVTNMILPIDSKESLLSSDVKDQIPSIPSLYSSSITTTNDNLAQLKSNLDSIIQPLLLTPYVWGGTTPQGFDCSGFTSYVFEKLGVSLSRVSESQFLQGTTVHSGEVKGTTVQSGEAQGTTIQPEEAQGTTTQPEEAEGKAKEEAERKAKEEPQKIQEKIDLANKIKYEKRAEASTLNEKFKNLIYEIRLLSNSNEKETLRSKIEQLEKISSQLEQIKKDYIEAKKQKEEARKKKIDAYLKRIFGE